MIQDLTSVQGYMSKANTHSYVLHVEFVLAVIYVLNCNVMFVVLKRDNLSLALQTFTKAMSIIFYLWYIVSKFNSYIMYFTSLTRIK